MLKYEQGYKQPNFASIYLSGQIAYLWCISPHPNLPDSFACMCVCSQECGCTFVWVHMHVHEKGRDSCQVLSSVTLCWGRLLCWTWNSLIWLASLSQKFCLYLSRALGDRAGLHAHPPFYMDAGDLNSGPHGKCFIQHSCLFFASSLQFFHSVSWREYTKNQ